MTYKEQIKHPKWQKKRLEILERDKFECFFCNYQSHKNHVHHKKYITGKLAWEYLDNDLMTVCNDCHRKIHYGLIQKKIDQSIIIKNIIVNKIVE